MHIAKWEQILRLPKSWSVIILLVVFQFLDINLKDSQRLFNSICPTHSVLSVVLLYDGRSKRDFFFLSRKCLNQSYMRFLLTASVPYTWTSIAYVSAAVFPNLLQNLTLIRCSILIWDEFSNTHHSTAHRDYYVSVFWAFCYVRSLHCMYACAYAGTHS